MNMRWSIAAFAVVFGITSNGLAGWNNWKFSNPASMTSYGTTASINCSGGAGNANYAFTVDLERRTGMLTSVEGSNGGYSASTTWNTTLSDTPWTATGSDEHWLVLRVPGAPDGVADEVQIVIN